MSEPELIFHDTVSLPDDQIAKARKDAEKQNSIVLAFFERHSDRNFTAIEVHDLLYNINRHDNIMLNSIRRSITNLTRAGRLIKCDWSESRQGRFGKMNRVWRFNKDYMKPINPQK